MAKTPSFCWAVSFLFTCAFSLLPSRAQTPLAERRDSVVVRVTDARSNQPLDAELKLSMCDDRSCFPAGKFNTGPLGMHIIKLPEKTTGLTIWVSRRGYVPKVVTWSGYRKDIIPSEYSIKLDPGVTIGGAVRDEQGNPVPNAKVVIQGPGTRNEAMSVEQLGLQGSFQTETTDAAGQWTCNAIPAKLENLNFSVTHPDFAPATFPFQKELWDGKATVVLKRGQGLNGVVLSKDGFPIRGAEIFVGASQFHRDAVKAFTDEHGRFALDKIPAGGKRITVTAEGFAPETRLVEIGPSSNNLKFELDLGGRISGTILDADDKPIEGVWIGIMMWKGLQVLAWNARTDSDGKFSWNSAPHDEARYNIGKAGFMEGGAAFKHGEHQTIRLPKATRVVGTVVDATTGEPIPHLQVYIGTADVRGEKRYHWDRHNGKKGHAGTFAFDLNEGLGGIMNLRVEAKEYRPLISAPFTNTPGEHTFSFKLEKAPPITGLVKTPDGQPAANATLVVCSGDNRAYMSAPRQFRTELYDSPHTRTDDQGVFTLPPLSEAEAIVVAHEDGFIEIPFSADQTNKLEIALKPWGRVTGKVFIGNTTAPHRRVMVLNQLYYGKPVPNVQVYLEDTTDAEGNFSIEGVPHGEQRVAYSAERSGKFIPQSHQTPILIEPGTNVHVTLGGSGRPVIGRVSVPTDLRIAWSRQSGFLESDNGWPEPPPRAGLNSTTNAYALLKEYAEKARTLGATPEGRALERDQRKFSVVFADDGSFRIEDVPSGNYRLNLEILEPGEGGPFSRHKGIGTTRTKFVIADIPGGRSDNPLDIGSLELDLYPPGNQRPTSPGPPR